MTDLPSPPGDLDLDPGADGDAAQLRFVRRFPHPPEKVWRALTEDGHLEAWFPTAIEGERRAGATWRFPFRNGEGPTMTGEVRVFDPPAVLEFSWGDDVLRFELRPVDGGCELTFLDRIDALGKAARDAAGWHVRLDRLEQVVAGGHPGDDGEHEAWGRVHPHYVAAFGPEAATIGPPAGAGAGSD